MQSIKVNFPNSAGEELAGILDLPPGTPRAFALFAHCFTCSKNLKAATNISRALSDAGIAVLRFDFTGLGQSGGRFEDTSFSSNVADLLSAADWLEREHLAPQILVGHSLGGTAVLQAAPSISSAVAVATIGSPADPEHVAHLFRGAEQELREKGVAEVELGGRPFKVREDFLDDLAQHNLPDAISGLRKALLILHAPLDDVVEIANASQLFAAAKHPKSFVSLDNADHLMSREKDSLYAGQVLAAWAARYLPDVAASNDVVLAGIEGGVVASTLEGGFRTDIVAGEHRLVADEPAGVGGSDAGPSPYDLLSAALASCTTMTLQMYAKHKNIELRSARVSVSHGKIHADDCVDCEHSSGKIDEFKRVLFLDGELTDAQRQRMLEIADRCPVHKTLHSEIKVRTSLETS
jgi:uncharacterized OsmC-like protein/alpha/beta superfamily hydrolase